MSEKIQVSVKTISVERRCRAGLCFSNAASVVEVDKAQLDKLQADAYLQVDVLTDDAATKQTGKKTQSNMPNANPPSRDADVNIDDVSIEAGDLAQQLAAAIRNSDIEIAAGKAPTVAEVKPLVSFDVNAALRDAAWALVAAA